MQDRELYESLDTMLRSLGEEKRSLVISALEASGIPFRPDSLDITSIDRVLFELFGMGSDALIISAYNRLSRRLALGFDDSQIASAADKIKKWVEVRNNNGNSAAIM